MDLEERILELITANPNGVTNAMLQAGNPTVTVAHIVDAINMLTAVDKIQIFHRGKHLLYKMKDPLSIENLKKVEPEEQLIYQLIEKAGNKGIWIRNIRYASNLPQTQINKVLKSLDSKKLIKSVTSVAESKKKVYMLVSIEPDISVTGGTWYSNQEFESEFVEVLSKMCEQHLQQTKIAAEKLPNPLSRKTASYKSSKDICDFINNLKVSKIVLTVQDIETILDALIYDGKVEKSFVAIDDDQSSSSDNETFQNMYRVIKPLVSSCGLMRVPCGVCPVYKECQETGLVSPTTCPYMKEWLEF